jgi:hypothetical protein
MGSTSKKAGDVWITDDAEDTVMGADPEFLLFNNSGEVVSARNVLSFHGEIGCDGAMAEVRPKPAISPETLVDNIRSIFSNSSLTDPIRDLKWLAGCYHKDQRRDYPLGGHIHVGNPKRVAQLSQDERQKLFTTFNKILDELLAIPMTRIDGSELSICRRTQCQMSPSNGYGYFGEWRLCNGRLEHRTLSGMWLMHPTLATMVFGTAKAIIDEVYLYSGSNGFKGSYVLPSKYNNKDVWRKNFDEWSNIPLAADLGCVKSSGKMIDLLHAPSARKVSLKYLANWYGKMRKLSTYSKYAKYIDGLYEILKNKTKAFHDYDRTIQRTWLGKAKFLD